MSNFSTRSITAVGFTVVMVGSALLGQMIFAGLMFFVATIGMKEFLKLNSHQNISPAVNITITLGLLVFSLLLFNALGLLEPKYLVLAFVPVFILFFVELWRKKEAPFLNISISIAAIVYIALPLGLLIYFFNPLATDSLQKAGVLLGYLIILWLNDTGAYIIGSAIGKHKLFERISPKKSWEGSIGGAVFSTATAFGISFVIKDISVTNWLVIAMITVVTGSLGDLVESMMKRSLGVKDSGTILPGHGGILDRFDAVLLSVPFVFIYLMYFCY